MIRTCKLAPLALARFDGAAAWAFGQDGPSRLVAVATKITDDGVFTVRDTKPEETGT